MWNRITTLILLFFTIVQLNANQKIIRISTSENDLVLQIAANNRLYQPYFGVKLKSEAEYSNTPYFKNPDSEGKVYARGWEVYPCLGAEDYFEPAFAIRHNDGNMTSILKYVSHSTNKIDDNVTETIITLKDEVYPVEVKLYYTAFYKENIIKSRTEISHNEKKPVTISQYVSSMLYFDSSKYFLTEFYGDFNREVKLTSQELKFGKKVIDTKLGARAAMYSYPFFQIGFDREVAENQGNVLMGTIAWTGNFRFTFEVDNAGNLRVLSGINPTASDYILDPKTTFKTPEFIFTLSDSGTGKASRNFHSWARKYQLKDGEGDRLTLLNNWEATFFDFDEQKLGELMTDAKNLGVDMFLLDDGWFGNKYPRVNDMAGLGDWEVMHSKLPNGIPGLVKKSKEIGVKFGLWVEPEMVNPKSELFEKHPDWAIMLPNREPYYFRSQLVLDMANPKVQDYTFGIIDKIMTENPEIAYLKWDCNSPITNIYSPYLKEKQGQLYIDHIRGVYNVFRQVKDKYPHLPMMLCSGGGARCDFEALSYFTEFWCSDNTNPAERIFIQWGFSQFMPSKAMCAHVTSWNKNASIKFRTDVAMMAKLGFDIDLKDLNKEELAFCQQAIQNYKRMKPVIYNGDQYRLVSPYDSNHASLMYVDEAKSKAVVFAYDMYPRYLEKLLPVKLQGLDPNRQYRIRETNLMPDGKSSLRINDKVYSGDYLMKVGIHLFTTSHTTSKVVELESV